MKETRRILLGLRVAYLIQMVVLFLMWVISTRRVISVATSLRHSLYESGASLQQVHRVDQSFSTLSSTVPWIFLTAMFVTSVGFGLLVSCAKKTDKTRQCYVAKSGGAGGAGT